VKKRRQTLTFAESRAVDAEAEIERLAPVRKDTLDRTIDEGLRHAGEVVRQRYWEWVRKR
jgi:hypothetical protein